MLKFTKIITYIEIDKKPKLLEKVKIMTKVKMTKLNVKMSHNLDVECHNHGYFPPCEPWVSLCLIQASLRECFSALDETIDLTLPSPPELQGQDAPLWQVDASEWTLAFSVWRLPVLVHSLTMFALVSCSRCSALEHIHTSVINLTHSSVTCGWSTLSHL